MPDDPLDTLPPAPAPAAVLPRPTATGPLTCEFCECTLTPNGHALTLSQKAKRWRDHNDDVAKLTAKNEAQETTIRELTRELAELKTKTAKKGIFD